MGMAASQARLLTITARIHDVEYQAQSIQNAKIQLATQQDQVYRDYLDALDATTLTYKTEDGYVSANFNNLCGFGNMTNNSIALRDDRGLLIVDDDLYQGYREFNNSGFGNSAYQFAMFMLDGENGKGKYIRYNDTDDYAGVKNIRVAEEKVYQDFSNVNDKYGDLKQIRASILELLGITEADLTLPDEKDYDPKEHGGLSYNDLCSSILATFYDAKSNEKIKDNPDDLKKYEELMNKYMYELYFHSSYQDDYGETFSGGAKIFEYAAADNLRLDNDFDEDKFNYYVTKYQQIQQCGGCISIDNAKFQGTLGVGNAATDGEWLQEMIKSGKITIDEVKFSRGTTTMQGTSPSSDSKIDYTATTSVDKRALKKAEAEYETNMKKIDQKDKAFDMSLSKLETQRTALTTEYESVKKVIQDNIDRTFGIFS